jgi:hypothetical protein
MAAPRQPVNGSTTSVGFTAKLVTVQAISPDGKTAVAVDRQNTQVNLPMMIQRSKGVLPAVGETWLATQDLGSWTFSAIVGQSAAQFQPTVSGSGVYTSETAPGTPSVGELWVNTSLDNMITVWNGTDWVPVQFGAVAIQPGSLTSAQLSEEAGIVASQVNFTATDIGGVTTTISATAPASPSYGDLWYDAANGYQLNEWTGSEWTPYQWGTQAIAARSVTTELLAAEAVTANEMAAGIIYGGIIDGTVVDAATFIGSTFEGTDFLLNSAGGFWYSSTPGLGNLFVNITSQPGTDSEGNPYQAGIFLFGPSGSFVAMEDNGSSATLLLNPAGSSHLNVSPQIFGYSGNAAAADEQAWLVLSSGKEASLDDAAIQLVSESADGTIPAHLEIEFGGTGFAQITKTGIVLPGVSATPPFVSGSTSLYGTSAGTLQVVDGVDGESYGTERRSLGISSAQTISSTSPGTVFSSSIGNRSYRVSGMLIMTPNQSAGAMGFTWQTSAASGLMSVLTTASTSSTAGTATWSRDGLGSGTTANLGPTMTSGDIYTARFDGYLTGSSGDTLLIQLNCGTSGDTFVLHPGSYIDIMPV